MNFNRIALIALLFLGTPAMSGQAPGDVNFITKGTAHLFQFKMHSLSTSETIETSKPCGSLKLGENQTLNLLNSFYRKNGKRNNFGTKVLFLL